MPFHHRKNLGRSGKSDFRPDRGLIIIDSVSSYCDRQGRCRMLLGDDRVIWGNLFKVLVVLVIVTLALIVLANALA